MTIDLMKEMAANESRIARKNFDTTKKSKRTTQLNWPEPSEEFNTRLVPRVMSCLRAGLGVEDMAANQTCTAAEARQVVSWMRANGSLERFYA